MRTILDALVRSLILAAVVAPPHAQAAAPGQTGISRIEGVAPRAERFDADGGRRGWRLRIPGGRPLATPCYDGGLVFVGGGYGSHEFYALDANTGEVVWRVRTQDDGPTAAIVHRGYVIFNTESCTLYVLEAKTGREVWSKWLGDPLMNHPAAEENRVYMAYPDSRRRSGGGHRVSAFELDSGRELWSTRVETDIITAPVVADEGVFVTCMDGTVYRLHKRTGEVIWRERRNATSAPLVRGGEVYASQRSSKAGAAGSPETPVHEEHVVAYKSASGRASGGTLVSRPAEYLAHANREEKREQAAQDASVGFASAPADAKLDRAQANIATLSTVSAGWRYQGSRPQMVGGKLVNSMGDTVSCVDPRTGAKEWEVTFEHDDRGRLLTPPAVAGDHLVLGSYRGEIVRMDRRDGKKTGSWKVGERVTFQPAVANGWIFAGTEGGSVVAIPTGDNSMDGWPMWGGSPDHNR